MRLLLVFADHTGFGARTKIRCGRWPRIAGAPPPIDGQPVLVKSRDQLRAQRQGVVFDP